MLGTRAHWDNAVQVLLVEDNSADARLVKVLFTQSPIPFNIEVATDGEAALDFLKKQGKYENAPTPDLILLDLNLPKKSGKEVLAEVKSSSALKSIPVIVLSTSSSDEDIARAYALHANSFITKPSELDEFSRIIKSIETFWLHTVRLPRKHAALTTTGWDWNL